VTSAGRAVRFPVAALLAAVLLAGCGSASRVTAGGAEPEARPVFPTEASPATLWLSAAEVPPGAEVVAILRNPTGTPATFGAAAFIDRWDGTSWMPHRFVGMCLDFWFCSGKPGPLDGDHAVPSIGLSASAERPGPVERFTTLGLEPGWYRIRQQANEPIVATGILHVADGAPSPAPLPPTDRPAISLNPALIGADGGRITALPILPTSGNGQTLDDVVAATADLAETASIDRWDGTDWRTQTSVELSPGTDGTGPHLDRTADIPALPAGAYRFVRHATDGRADYTGRFWVADDAPVAVAPSATTSTPGSDPPSPPASTVAACPSDATEPSVGNAYCGPEPTAGNGDGPDGLCTGRESRPPCGRGVEPGRWYPYTLAIDCDAHMLFNGQRWVSTLGPPPAGEAPRHVWIQLYASDQAGVLSPTMAVGYKLDPDGPPTTCQAPPSAPPT
jgi:hypothetical protein